MWALKNVSFEVRKGEAFGIIGPNGAGKTTILKLLANITRPTSGKVTVDGRVASLIELGAGFHPELTGRENIYLNGVIMGLSRLEIKRKFDAIVEFSGLERFIDTPVKRYSSGMYARLGFSVAAHLEPSVLLVDEVLSVGDAAFQQKSLQRMGRLVDSGVTLIFVSHNLFAVQTICSRVMWLSEGQVQFLGEPAKAIGAYMDSLDERLMIEGQDQGLSLETHEEPGLRITAVKLRNGLDKETKNFQMGDDIQVEICYKASRRIEKPFFTLGINHGRTGCLVYASMFVDGPGPIAIEGEGCVVCHFQQPSLMPAVYQIWVQVDEEGTYRQVVPWYPFASFRVVSDSGDFPSEVVLDIVRGTGSMYVPHRWQWT